MKVEPVMVGERKVYPVSAWVHGVGTWIARLPSLWVEGEISELRRQDAWQTVFFTLKDPSDGTCLPVTMARTAFDRVAGDIAEGARVHVHGRPDLYEPRADFRLRAVRLERVGEGDLLAQLEQLRRRLAAEGLFASERKRPLPTIPRRIGLVTGNEAAAKRDVLTAIATRFPPARILVLETIVQGPRAPGAIVGALATMAAQPEIDVIVLARGGGSLEDLLPFSDERVVRAVASCPVPVVSAVGHEQDAPLCDLAADARASTPTASARLVVPDWHELSARLGELRSGLGSGARRRLARARDELAGDRARLARAPTLGLERRRASSARRGSAWRPRARGRSSGGGRRSTPRPAPARALPGRDPRARLRDRPQRGARRPRRGRPDGGGAARRRARERPRRGHRRRGGRVSGEHREPTFDEARDELVRIVDRLERGDVGLEEAVELWERGEALVRLCEAKLDAAQARVDELGRTTPGPPAAE
ncbi:MAG: exodeoxyribonuclease VII large subunit [Thermoleophilia bacterium]